MGRRSSTWMLLCTLVMFVFSLGPVSAQAEKKILVILSSANQLPLASPRDKSISTGIFLVEMGEMIRRYEALGYEFDFATPDGVFPTVDINGFDLAFYEGNYLKRLARNVLPLPEFVSDQAAMKRHQDVSTAWRHLGRLTFSSRLPRSDSGAFRFSSDQLGIQSRARMAKKPVLSIRDDLFSVAENEEGESVYELQRELLDQYAAIYVDGGHAPMVDLRNDPWLGDVLTYFQEEEKFIVAICHGPIALASARFTIDGRTGWARRDVFPFERKRITTVAKHEELMMLRFGYPKVPGEKTRLKYYVDEALEAAGLRVVTNGRLRPGASKVVRDGRLITGNGPQAISDLVDEMTEVLR